MHVVVALLHVRRQGSPGGHRRDGGGGGGVGGKDSTVWVRGGERRGESGRIHIN